MGDGPIWLPSRKTTQSMSAYPARGSSILMGDRVYLGGPQGSHGSNGQGPLECFRGAWPSSHKGLKKQCEGSGSELDLYLATLWIRISIPNTYPYPHIIL